MLSEDVERLRNEALAGIAELHDDYLLNRALWRLLSVRVGRYKGSTIIVNPTTGSRMDAADLATRVSSSVRRLTERSFKEALGRLEAFAGELLRLWLTEHPRGRLRTGMSFAPPRA